MIEQNFHDVIGVLERLNCRWWLDAGNCLGVVRGDGFVKDDNDIDIGMKGDHVIFLDRFKEEFEALDFKMVKMREYQGKKVTLGFKRFGIKLDLYFYHEKDDFLWHAVYKHGVFYPMAFRKSLFDNLKPVKFLGRNIYLPNPPEQYLEDRYGEDWRTPKPDFKYWDSNDCKAINMGFLDG